MATEPEQALQEYFDGPYVIPSMSKDAPRMDTEPQADEMVLVCAPSSPPRYETMHQFRYTSSGVKHGAILTLRHCLDTDRRVCSFHTLNNISDDHGMWSIDIERSIIIAHFNYKYQGDADPTLNMPLHPTSLTRKHGVVWEGHDDKLCTITCTQLLSRCRVGKGPSAKWVDIDMLWFWLFSQCMGSCVPHGQLRAYAS